MFNLNNVSMKAKLWTLLVVLCMSFPLLAQQKPPVEMGKDGIYLVTDKMPEFPGGMHALMKYVSENVKYPTAAQEKGVSGRVIVQFVVLEDGTISQEQIARGVDEHLDAEALRVVKAMPKWTPGTVDGKPVKVRFTVPVMFRLSGGKTGNSFQHVAGPLLPIGKEVKDKSLTGIWQSCKVALKENGYQLYMESLLKILSADKTFTNVFTSNGKMVAAIMAYGEYELEGDNVYVEILKKSAISEFPEGARNRIQVEHLHDNLIKFTFSLPGKDKPWTEYWYRIPTPDIKIIAN